jgi:6-pyruvoyltetrahydropterin/6-carboxytetrahydropterin synthase
VAVYEVSVDGSFSARHAIRLPNGKLEEPHGHTWRVTATFGGRSLHEPAGVLVDFLRIRAALDEIVRQLEGADLNELPAFGGKGASAERVAKFLAEALADRMEADGEKLCGLAVTEAPGCVATYYP